ncbi:MAG: hypothetical protein K5897_06695 [Eubacterium sp.]|nr:hypothetical protein [Eubacterium sp.]
MKKTNDNSQTNKENAVAKRSITNGTADEDVAASDNAPARMEQLCHWVIEHVAYAKLQINVRRALVLQSKGSFF